MRTLMQPLAIVGLTLILSGARMVVAQTPPTPTPTVEQAKPATTPAAKPAKDDGALTPLEQKDVTIASLRQQIALLTAQLQVCQGDSAATNYQRAMSDISNTTLATIRAEYRKNHPGWDLDDNMKPIPLKKGG